MKHARIQSLVTRATPRGRPQKDGESDQNQTHGAEHWHNPSHLFRVRPTTSSSRAWMSHLGSCPSSTEGGSLTVITKFNPPCSSIRRRSSPTISIGTGSIGLCTECSFMRPFFV